MSFTVIMFQTIGPIIILLGIGILIRKNKILSTIQIEGIKTLIIKFALPSALFLTFLQMELKFSLAILPVFIFILSSLTFIYGKIRLQRNSNLNPAFPYIMSSFEFGMLGLILFSAAFGSEHLGKLAIAALGQEFFVWFIMIPHVSGLSAQSHSKMHILKSFISNPALIGIFTGLVLNISGYAHWSSHIPVLLMLISTLKSLSGLIVPSVLIFIGYGMVINRDYIKETSMLILQRLSVMFIPVALFIYFIVYKLFNLDILYSLGIITLFLLPPPFVIPLFLDDKRKSLLPRINGILILYTIFSISAFCIMASFFPYTKI